MVHTKNNRQGILQTGLVDALWERLSIIPLIGGPDAARGKAPAVPWKPYMRRRAGEARVQQWMAQGLTAYGIVCGKVSKLVVLDFDDPAAYDAFAARFPELLNTRIVISGLRGTPHIYWRVDFPVQSCKITGGDLQAEGSYVVGPGSQIAGGTWEIAQHQPIRAITQAALGEVLKAFGTTPKTPSAPQNPAAADQQAQSPGSAGQGQNSGVEDVLKPRPFSSGDATALYRHRVAATGSRNMALFEVACALRDAGHAQQWTLQTLADLHAQEPAARPDHPPENPATRRAEAARTIASAYSRPPRPRQANPDPGAEPASRIPNSAREALLQRPDGPATLRTLEGLLLKGLAPGSSFTEKQAVDLLKGVVGRYSIRKALASQGVGGKRLFSCSNLRTSQVPGASPPDPLTTAAADIQTGPEVHPPNARLLAGSNQTEVSNPRHRPPKYFTMPSIEQLCAALDVPVTGSDPVRLADLRSRKTYRMALEREFIRRRPGQHFQDLLASRLGVTSRTIRRYHQEIPVYASPRYLERPVYWFNLDQIPAKDDIQRYELALNGQFLLDDTGKRWPVQREIARRLLANRHKVLHCIQTASYYSLEPALPQALYIQHGQQGHYREQQRLLPLDAAPQNLHIQQEPAAQLPQRKIIQNNTNIHFVQEKLLAEAPGPPRNYRRALPNHAEERLAQQVYALADGLSLARARELVDRYGKAAVKRAISSLRRLKKQGKLRSPAGFMCTAARVNWKEQQRKQQRKQSGTAATGR